MLFLVATLFAKSTNFFLRRRSTHLFCRCLTNITSVDDRPPTCPLCRKGFKRDPVKIRRLHANGPPADEVKYTDLLERLVLAWKLTESDPELGAETQQFLEGQDENKV